MDDTVRSNHSNCTAYIYIIESGRKSQGAAVRDCHWIIRNVLICYFKTFLSLSEKHVKFGQQRKILYKYKVFILRVTLILVIRLENKYFCC